jgi:O-antigen/teichoic acid export membrane protein
MSQSSAPPPPPDHHATASGLGKIARGGVLMLGGSGIETGLGFALAVVAGRLLGKHDFGLFNLGWQVVTLSLILSEIGLPMAVLRYVAVYDGEQDPEGAKGAAYGGTLFAGLLGGAIAVVLMLGGHWVAAHAFRKPDLAPILPIMAIQLPIVGVMTMLMRVTQARGTMRYRVLVEKVLLPSSRLLFIGLLLAAGLGLVGAAWGSTVACALCLVAATYMALGVMRRAWGAVPPRWREVKPVLLYAIPLVLSALALFGRRRGVILALGVSGTASDIGLYSAAERAALAGAMGLNAIGAIFSPIAADLYNRKHHDELHQILKTSAAWIVMVVLPAAVLLALCAPEVLAAFGKDFPEAELALTILAAAQIINCTFGSVDYLFAMAAKQWVAVIDLTFFACVSMGLAYYLAPRMGVAGAAIAGAVGLLGPRTARVTEVAVLLRMNPFGRGHLRVAACAVPPAILAVVWRLCLRPFFPVHAFVWVLIPAYAALYLLLLPLLARHELDGLLNVIRERRRRMARRARAAADDSDLPSASPTAGGDEID